MLDARVQIANFLDSLLFVYSTCIIIWIVLQFVFSLGVRVPYSRALNAVMDFLRDICEPFLRLFRRLPLQVGPLDLTPLVAIFTLQIVGGLVVGLVQP